jgi:3-hydroxybutyryl-CoA dehydrogenase
MAIQRVGVVGCGLMGSGIVQVTAQAGHAVRVREVDDAALARGLARIDKFLQGGVDKGKMTAEEKAAIVGRIQGTTRLEDLGDCDLVIEAAIENIEAKHAAFAALDAACRPEAIFASNTSSLSITEMAARTKRPARFVGLHFFNPVPLMKLVEVVRTPMTDPAVLAEVEAFATGLPKVVVSAQDTPGFVVNRLLVPFLLDAIRVLESGIATREDIDAGMVLGCGHPMGPLTLLDFVGLDTTLYIADIMFDEFKEPRFAPPPLLKRMVLAGWHGRKSGRGFYDYSAAPAAKAKPEARAGATAGATS